MNTYSQSLARTVISTTGCSTVDNMGLLSYSVGESVIGSLYLETNCITQGFQQPSLLNLDFDKVTIDAVEVFPNPVTSILTILYNVRIEKSLQMDLLSISGRLLRKESFTISDSGWIDVEMSSLSCGIYILHLYSTDKQIDRTFKIEKM